MSEEEISLEGGNLSAVFRVGGTVRRPLHSWSPAVHGLLRHLEAQGFSGAPRFLGIDAQNREILTYLPGEVGFMPYWWDGDAPLVAAASLLRSYHDATVGYHPPPEAAWQFVYPDESRHEVIGHNDFAPYNLVCVNRKPNAVIDFDMAGPGPRLRDIAYAAYSLVPLSFHSPDLHALTDADVVACSRRLHLLCNTYGITATPELLDHVEEVLQFLGDWLERQAGSGNTACRTMIEDGHLAHWRAEREYFQQNRRLLEQNLHHQR